MEQKRKDPLRTSHYPILDQVRDTWINLVLMRKRKIPYTESPYSGQYQTIDDLYTKKYHNSVKEYGVIV